MGLIPNATSRVLERALEFRNQRHDVIATNVANASTPGFRAFDLVLANTVSAQGPLLPRITDPRHLSQSGPAAAVGASPAISNAPARLDGNNVSIETELVKLLENRTVYQAAFELRDKLGGLTAAARDVR